MTPLPFPLDTTEASMARTPPDGPLNGAGSRSSSRNRAPREESRPLAATRDQDSDLPDELIEELTPLEHVLVRQFQVALRQMDSRLAAMERVGYGLLLLVFLLVLVLGQTRGVPAEDLAAAFKAAAAAGALGAGS